MMSKVEPYSCWDGVVNGGTGDEELENILSVLDFPMESLEGHDGFVGDWDVSKSQFLGPIPLDVLMGLPAVAHDDKVEFAPIDAAPEPKHILPHNKCTEVEIDATPEPKRIHPQNKCTEVQEKGFSQTQSPVSVLESTSSSSTSKNSSIKSRIGKRTRSKRARPSGLSSWLLRSPLFPASTKTCNNSKKNKERRRKLSRLSVSTEDLSDTGKSPFRASNYVEAQNGGTHRPAIMKKCTHCEVTKTPQWREGPLGPKTLCNACGVRYRSGRLYPEYRPAASPTFVESLHSNSHRKVIEMRTKAKQQQISKADEPPVSPQLEFIPMSSYLFDSLR